MPKPKSALRAAMLLLPLLLLQACSTPPAPPLIVAPPSIPPLPAEARQVASPTFSQKWSAKVAEWQKLLTPQ